MKCKFCGAQLEKDKLTCPECGKKNEPEKKESVNIWMAVGATAVCMLLLMLLAVMVINSITGRNWPFDLIPKETTGGTAATGTSQTDPVSPTEETLAGPEELGMSIEGMTDIALYAVDDAAALAAVDEVIAQVGDYTLTNGLLQVFYRMEFSNFVAEAQEQGYDLAGGYNLDITKPMGEQKVVGSTVTWEQFFLHNALGTWWRYVGINIMADEAGFVLSDEHKSSLASVPAQLEADAATEGFESADAMIKDRLGAACDLDDYVAYMELTARGDLYSAEYQKNYIPTEEEVKAFFELNADYYGTYIGVTAETGKVAAVRHVLLEPEGCEKDSYTGYVTATDEQWAAALTTAEAMLNSWVASGATEESFAEMANDHSVDGGSNTKGGLYEGVLAGQMVEAFDAWVFDESRKPGDYGIVRTQFGHHLMYFVSMSEHDAWYEYAYKDAINYGYGLANALGKTMEAHELVPALDKIAVTDIAIEITETEEETSTGTTDAE